MDWMSEKVAPKMKALTGNVWITALQESITKALPTVLVGSLITIYNGIKIFIPSLLVLSDVRNYTFGLISIFMVFLILYYILEVKRTIK